MLNWRYTYTKVLKIVITRNKAEPQGEKEKVKKFKREANEKEREMCKSHLTRKYTIEQAEAKCCPNLLGST